jgi:alkylation response protein AidB-like acyl-CoA dehydrogenase
MGIALTAEQHELSDAVAALGAKHAPSNVTRVALDDLTKGARPAAWQHLIDSGFLALHLSTEYGGDGAELTELAIVVEQAALRLVPGPLLPTVLTSFLLSQYASDALMKRVLPAFARGATGATGTEPGALCATPDANGIRLSGRTAPVLGLAAAEFALLPARHEDGAVRWYCVETKQLTVTPGDSVDVTRDISQAVAQDVIVAAENCVDVDTALVRSVIATLFAAEASGLARWCQQTGVEYAKVREQFGRPIGEFQAIKHKCAKLFARTELMTAAAWDAAMAFAEGGHQFDLAAATAAVVAVGSAPDIALETITLLGGIGYTWEHDAQLYWRRAVALQMLLGTRGAWQERLGRLAIDGSRAHSLKLENEPEGYREKIVGLLREARALEGTTQRAFLAEKGLAAPHYPAPYGLGASAVEQIVIAEEFASAGLSQPSMIVGDWAVPTIIAHGSDAQHERFVNASLRGEIVWCQLFSEPGAGSDLASLRTRAEKVEGGWLLNGQKVWTSKAHEADFGICLARTDPEAEKRRGISYFLIDMTSPGLDIRPLREANGEYMFNEVFFDNVFVPDEMLVGAPNEGWKLARTTLSNERVNISGGFGFKRDLPSEHLARMSTEPTQAQLCDAGRTDADVFAFRAMSHRIVLRQVEGIRPGPEASVLKVVSAWNETATRRLILDWQGPEAVLDVAKGQPVFDYLSLPQQLIGGGTVEVQLNLISEVVLGLPRG